MDAVVVWLLVSIVYWGIALPIWYWYFFVRGRRKEKKSEGCVDVEQAY